MDTAKRYLAIFLYFSLIYGTQAQLLPASQDLELTIKTKGVHNEPNQ